MSETTVKEIEWTTLVEEQEGPNKTDDEYEFSNGRKFKRDDDERRGIYTPEE